MSLIQPLFDGPLDVVGDIHGEIDALRSLLAHLGYRDGLHPAGRRLVFVGDLCDRGPDSRAVVALVRDLVERDLAQCILGNHELNVLRGEAKHGNRWIIDPEHHENRDEFRCATVTPAERASLEEFFRTLPLALERRDLRVVHASWDDDAIAAVRAASDSNIVTFQQFEESSRDELDRLHAEAKLESQAHKGKLEDPTYPMPLLTSVGRYEQQRQMLNPVRVLTSGCERATDRQFFATGKWRFCDRVRWWTDYTDATPIVFGHYWRGTKESNDKPDLFEGSAAADWLGPGQNAFCIDFSVGARFRERLDRAKRGIAQDMPFATRLGAVRWPERSVVFDDSN